ncbi:MAG: porin family protein [Muribaculaceae bacterium]|nr:porin family protein [Muribaculaceae bacterium]
MKKLILLASSVLLSASAFAESNMYVGGSLGVWHDETADATSATITPEIGFNLNDKWTVGTTIGYSYKGNDNVSNNSFVFYPYARFNYFRAGIVSLFVEGGLDMKFGRTDVGDNNGDTSAFCGICFKPGVTVALNDKFSLVAKLGDFGFHLANDAAEVAGLHKGYGLDLYNNVSFGFYYNF